MDDPGSAEDPRDAEIAAAPSALDALRAVLHARSIRSAQAASDDPVSAPVRAAWIID